MPTRMLAVLAVMASTATAQTVSVIPASSTATSGTAATQPLVPPGTPVRLMVVREVNSRTAHAGDRFKLRVDEPVYIDGAPVIPVGATAWGEIASVEANGAVGKGGKLGARLLYVDLPSGRVPLRGEAKDKGDGNGAGVVLAIVGFGILGLLNGGDSARLKAGDLVTAYVDKAPEPDLPATPSAGQETSADQAPATTEGTEPAETP